MSQAQHITFAEINASPDPQEFVHRYQVGGLAYARAGGAVGAVDYQKIETIVRKVMAGRGGFTEEAAATTSLMNIDVVARRLGVHPDTIKRLARRGDLEHYKVTKKMVKFDEQQVRRFLDKVRSGAVKLPTVHRFPLLINKRSSS